MLIQPEFVPVEAHDRLLDVLTDPTSVVPWYYIDRSSGQDSGAATLEHDYGFYHLAYNEGRVTSDLFDLLLPLLSRLPMSELIRVRFGMQTNVGQEGQHGWHTDFTSPHWTCLWYVGDSDGDTLFDVDGEVQRIPHTRNLSVTFDGMTPHCSSAPVKHSRRLAVNVNYR